MKRRRGEGGRPTSTANGVPERRRNTKPANPSRTATTLCLLAGSLHLSGNSSGRFAVAVPSTYAQSGGGIDRLPQRRIRTPTRAVRYPADHPLGRHQRHLVAASQEVGGALGRDDSEDGGRAGEEEAEMDGDAPTASPTPAPPTPEPIRIVPILTATTQRHLTKSQQHYLLDTVLRPAIEAWSAVIRLIRAEGNLTLDRNQLWDGISCGPGLDGSGVPSALVPEHHFDDFDSGAVNATMSADADSGDGGVGVPNADLVVYIELGFREREQQQQEAQGDPTDATADEEDVAASAGATNNNFFGPGSIRGSDPLYKDAGFHHIPQEVLEESEFSAPVENNPKATLSPANGLVNTTHPSLGDLIPSETSAASLLASKAPALGTMEHPKCSPAYLASATHCSTDQYDRPTHGMIHLCIDPDTFFTSDTEDIKDIKHLQLTQLILLHEIAHVLGFNLQSLAHFRERDGKPRTPRLPVSPVAIGDETDRSPWLVGDVPDVSVECTGILNKRNRRRKRATIPLPAETTLKFRTIRGGVRVADVVTPTVQAVVRNHFSCNALEGAELEGDPYHVERLKESPLHGLTQRQSEDDTEDEHELLSKGNNRRRHLSDLDDDHNGHDADDGRDRRGDYDYLDNAAGDQVADTPEDFQYYNADADVGGCIEDHWSRRIFKNDLMNPVVTDVPLPRPESLVLSSSDTTVSLLPAISPLTLAYFADSGWYDVQFSKASPSSGPWGRGAGCPFVNEKCIMANGKVRAANSAFFCNDPRARLPTAAHKFSDTSQPSTLRSVHSTPKAHDAIEWTGCSDDGLRKASCDVVRYAKSLPEEYSYFSSTSSFLKDMSPSERQSVGGPDMSLDYCPVYNPPVPQEEDAEGEITLCTSPKSARHRLKDMEDFGPGARCVTGRVDGQKAALCVSVACVLSDQSLRIKVDGVWTKCQFPGQVLRVWPHDWHMICPDIKIMCPTFYCPRDCLGAGGIDGEGNPIDGVCDGEAGQCMCPELSEAPSAAPTSTSDATAEPTLMTTVRATESDGGLSTTAEPSDKSSKSIPEDENTEQSIEQVDDFPRKFVPCQRAYLVNSDNMDRPHWPWMKPPLSDIYVERAKYLVDIKVDILTRTFRLFSSMSTGDVIGFLAISVVVVLGAGIGGMGAVKVYKKNTRGGRIGSSISSSGDGRRGRRGRLNFRIGNVRPDMFSISSPGTPRFRVSLGGTRSSPPSNTVGNGNGARAERRSRYVDRRLRNSFRVNKDKAVATMLMDLRVNNPARKRRQRRRDLLLRRQQRRRREIQERVRHLSMRSIAHQSQDFQMAGESVVRHSDLPPLPEGGGRVVAIVGALFIDDVPDEDVGSDPFNNRDVDDASLPDTETSGHITNTTACGDCTATSGGRKSDSRNDEEGSSSDIASDSAYEEDDDDEESASNKGKSRGISFVVQPDASLSRSTVGNSLLRKRSHRKDAV